MKCNILFLTLKIFSATGGIEKVCRIAGKALHEMVTEDGGGLKVYSMYDEKEVADNKYFDESIFKGFRQNKTGFVTSAIKEGIQSDVVILSHINLLVVGRLIKLLSPKTKLLLFAHGIEVWKPLPAWKRIMLSRVDTIICVSHFTKDKMRSLYGMDESKLKVLNNCLDPFLEEPKSWIKDETLLNKYGLQKDDVVLLTLSRLSSHDRDKGYNKVLFALHDLLKDFPTLKYMIAGKYEEAEKQWLDELIESMGLKQAVIFTGFVKDDELASHFSIAEVYVMPSTKEGFGIIFIEAMFYDLPVIAGNKDGSVDALSNGDFGMLVDPNNQQHITDAIKKVLLNKEQYKPDRKKLMVKFSYPVYKNNLKNLLSEVALKN